MYNKQCRESSIIDSLFSIFMSSVDYNDEHEPPSRSDRPGGIRFTFRDEVGHEAELNQFDQGRVLRMLQKNARKLACPFDVEQSNFQQLSQYISETEARLAETVPVGTIVANSMDQPYRITSTPSKNSDGLLVVEGTSLPEEIRRTIPLYYFLHEYYRVVATPAAPEPEALQIQLRDALRAKLRELLKDSLVDFEKIDPLATRLEKGIAQKQARRIKDGKDPVVVDVDDIALKAAQKLLDQR